MNTLSAIRAEADALLPADLRELRPVHLAELAAFVTLIVCAAVGWSVCA